jgi:hypothetical protein
MYRYRLQDARTKLSFAIQARELAAMWGESPRKVRGWRWVMRKRALEWRAVIKMLNRPAIVPADVRKLEIEARKGGAR